MTSDPGRLERLQARLHEIFPLYRFMDLSVESLGEPVRMRAPLSAGNGNHFGVMYAGVLFSLGEAAGGLAVTQHRDLGALTLIATHIEIDYLRPARTGVVASAVATAADLAAIREGLARDPRHTFEVPVTLADEAGQVVARSRCHFQLRAPR